MNIILLGPPGAGKGTQAEYISKKFDLNKVSTGDLFRENIKNNSPLGQKANEFVNSGKLVPDQIVTDMINNWLISNTDNWLLDGFPRTINQAKSLNQILKSCNQILNSVLLISVPNNMLVDRLLERQKIEKRSDDNMETIQVRINTYEEETKPLITYYQQENILSEIDGSQSISNVSISIEKELANIKKKINN
ncbi:MAG: adenylate kinase [Chloroflexi bacterium]|nr:adenylate kinase [Chloroflexota bacterium]|tara:strand:+ start:829 stop:1407 length:579 start_codon:yes stop_codon:yes gene_type:complete